MDDNITKTIKEKFDSLPESVQEVILSSHYEEILLEIGKQYQLNIEQMGILERETTLVMMGLTPLKDFENELTRELNIDKIKGSQIVKDINEKVFFRIRELLKLMNTPIGENPSIEEPKEEEEIQKETPTPLKIKITEKPAPSSPKTNENNEIHPLLAQKLTGSFQVPITTTEHTINNLTKTTPLLELEPGTPSTIPKPKPPLTSYPPQQDPYRLSPNE